jgi:hypothetical protein
VPISRSSAPFTGANSESDVLAIGHARVVFRGFALAAALLVGFLTGFLWLFRADFFFAM